MIKTILPIWKKKRKKIKKFCSQYCLCFLLHNFAYKKKINNNYQKYKLFFKKIFLNCNISKQYFKYINFIVQKKKKINIIQNGIYILFLQNNKLDYLLKIQSKYVFLIFYSNKKKNINIFWKQKIKRKNITLYSMFEKIKNNNFYIKIILLDSNCNIVNNNIINRNNNITNFNFSFLLFNSNIKCINKLKIKKTFYQHSCQQKIKSIIFDDTSQAFFLPKLETYNNKVQKLEHEVNIINFQKYKNFFLLRKIKDKNIIKNILIKNYS